MRSANILFWIMLALATLMSYKMLVKPTIEWSKASGSYGRGISTTFN